MLGKSCQLTKVLTFVQAAGAHPDWALLEDSHWVDQIVNQLVTEASMADTWSQVAIVVSSDVMCAKLAEPCHPLSNSHAGQQMVGSNQDAFLNALKVCISLHSSES